MWFPRIEKRKLRFEQYFKCTKRKYNIDITLLLKEYIRLEILRIEMIV